MLRLISFSIDYHWACNRIGIADVRSLSACSCPTGLSSHALRLQPGRAVDDKKRAAVFHSRETYTFRSYLAYVLYAPLYIAGPIITFNDFMWQVRTRYPIIIVPGAHVFASSSPVRRISRPGRRRDTRCAFSFRYLRWKRSSMSCTLSRSKMRARGVV
jgi:hypothetical protein